MSTSSPSAQIGRYGTISLMKRQDPSVPLTSFGIDTPELTFGRDPSCGVRLYYTEIAVVHCRIVFDEDRKAFMCVLGESGVIVDGCSVNGGGEMVPLMNGSEFEIRGKKFRFTYPPKEMRAALCASPVPTRAPRLSLITSTHVFSPRPSPDPRENLRILKSPLKNTFKGLNRGTTPLRTLFASAASRYAYNSPSKPSAPAPLPTDEEDEEEDSIVLVDGNHPRVVEDEKDLVILEDIDRPLPPSTHAHGSPYLHAPQPRTAQQEPPRTPVRKRSQSLHRAVLIRSAQRAVLKAERDEREREEDEMDEMEVLDVVAGLDGEDGHAEERKQEQEQGQEQEEYADMDVDMDVDMEEPLAGGSDDEQEKKQQPKQKLTWRKSFERLWPFRSSSPTKDEESTSSDEDEDENENELPAPPPPPSISPTSEDADEEYENEHPAPLFLPPRTPLRPQLQHQSRTLGPFMTPQPQIGPSVSDPMIHRTAQRPIGGAAGRFSLGGGEARRVVAESQVWRVKDIVVPPPSPAVGGSRGALASPVRPSLSGSPRKVVVGEEERKAIQERRRSALREPSGLGFVPGFSPMKTKSTSLVFPGGAGSGPGARQVSPTKASTQPTLPAPSTSEKEEEEEDTRRLLERMKETVEGMKRRRSEVLPPPPPSPPPQVPMTPGPVPFTPTRGRSPEKKGRFSLLRMEPRKEERVKVKKENETEEMQVEKEDEVSREETAPVPVLEAEDASPMDKEPAHEQPRPKSKANSPAPVAVRSEDVDISQEPACEKPRSKSKAKSPAPVRVQEEAETVSTQPAREKPRSKSKARSPAMEYVPMDQDQSKAEEINDLPQAEAETTQVKQEKPRSKPRSRSKSTLRVPSSNKRTTRVSPALAPEPQESIEEPKVRGRKATVTPTVEEAQPKEAPVKRGRKATTTSTTTPAVVATPAPPISTSSSTQDESAPTRRARKPTVDPEEKEAPKRGRKLGVTTAAKNVTRETEAPKRGVRKTPASTPAPVVDNEKEPVKRGRTPRAGSVVPTSSKTARRGEVDEEDEGKEKKVTVKGRKRAGMIKKEDDAGSLSGDGVNAPTTSTATTTTSTKARTPAVGARTRKTPASAPVVPMQEVNKENENGEEEGVKVRVSRKGRGKKDVVTQDDDEAEVEVEVIEKDAAKGRTGRATRATRARTRT